MKKLLLVMLVIFTTFLYGVEITKMSHLDFGEVVQGDRYVKLSNIKVYVEGIPNKTVEINYPDNYSTEAGEITMVSRERKIRLSKDGRGRFTLDCKLRLRSGRKTGIISDKIPISVSYD